MVPVGPTPPVDAPHRRLERMDAAGVVYGADIEEPFDADIRPARVARYSNLCVLAVPGAPAFFAEPRSPEKSLGELGLVHPLIEHDAGQPCAHRMGTERWAPGGLLDGDRGADGGHRPDHRGVRRGISTQPSLWGKP